jgi:uncharacterized ion transporter superfamily protein YfcC
MKKEITLGQLLSVAVTLLIAIVGGWIAINNKVTSHDSDIYYIKQRLNSYDKLMDRVESKIDGLDAGQTKILIELQDKQRRK